MAVSKRGTRLGEVRLGHGEEQAKVWVQLPCAPPVRGELCGWPCAGSGAAALGEGEEGAHAGWAVTASGR